VVLPLEALQRLAEATPEPMPAPAQTDRDAATLQSYLALLGTRDLPALRQRLALDLARAGCRACWKPWSCR
jgi:hypothetical protein